MIVVFREDGACYPVEVRVDVPRGGMVLAPLVSGSELTVGHQVVYVVGTHEVLRHTYYCCRQRHLAVVVRGVLGHVTT